MAELWWLQWIFLVCVNLVYCFLIFIILLEFKDLICNAYIGHLLALTWTGLWSEIHHIWRDLKGGKGFVLKIFFWLQFFHVMCVLSLDPNWCFPILKNSFFPVPDLECFLVVSSFLSNIIEYLYSVIITFDFILRMFFTLSLNQQTGKTSFVEHRTFLHIYRSFHRLWIFLALMFQVSSCIQLYQLWYWYLTYIGHC